MSSALMSPLMSIFFSKELYMVPKKALSAEEFFCLEGCTSYEQYYHMRHQFEHGICPFCNIDPSVNNVAWQSGSWVAWENAFSNKRACSVMLVIAHREHVRRLDQISSEDWCGFHKIMGELTKDFALQGGMLFMRFGDMRLNAGTVPHLHWNLWVPDGTGEVRVPIYKDANAREKNRSRASVFSARYEAHEIP